MNEVLTSSWNCDLHRSGAGPYAAAIGAGSIDAVSTDAISTLDFSMSESPVRGADKDKEKDGQNGNGAGGDGDGGSGTAVITRTRTQTRRPGMYRVLLLNDDYTPMEFVVVVLRKYFSKGPDEATRIMLHVHQHGVGECGIFTYEVAETKVTQVMDYARKHQHPLQCIMEKK